MLYSDKTSSLTYTTTRVRVRVGVRFRLGPLWDSWADCSNRDGTWTSDWHYIDGYCRLLMVTERFIITILLTVIDNYWRLGSLVFRLTFGRVRIQTRGVLVHQLGITDAPLEVGRYLVPPLLIHMSTLVVMVRIKVRGKGRRREYVADPYVNLGGYG